MQQFMNGIFSAVSSVSPSVPATADEPCSTSRMLIGECKPRPQTVKK